MKVLVMGGSRFNGYSLVHELVRHGHEVTTLSRGQTAADFPPEVHRLYADRKDHAQLREVFRGLEFDCIQDTSAYELEDVQSVVEMFEGRAGHYIFASSTTVYATPKILPLTEESPLDTSERALDYAKNKIICENYLVDQWRTRNFPTTSTRYSMVLGPRNLAPQREQMMFTRMLQGRPILIPGDGHVVQQVGHVDDQSAALRMMMQNPRTYGEIYTLTGNQYWSTEHYVDTIAEIVGVTPQKVFVPGDIMDEVVKQIPYQLIQGLSPNLNGWRTSVVLSIDKLRQHLDWEPKHTFHSGMAQTYEWFEREKVVETANYDFSHEDRLLERLGVSRG